RLLPQALATGMRGSPGVGQGAERQPCARQQRAHADLDRGETAALAGRGLTTRRLLLILRCRRLRHQGASMSVPEPPAPARPENGMLTGGWESERDTERAKVSARWFAIAILYLAIEWIRRHDPKVQLPNVVLYSLVGAAIAMTALETAYLWQPDRT